MGLFGWIFLQQTGDRRVLRLTGEIDLGVVHDFERRHWEPPTPVDAVDAGDVTFIGAAGLNLVLRWRHASGAEGRPLVLSRSCRRLDRLVELLGLDGAFPRPARDS